MAESPDLPRYAHRMHAIYERFPVGSELTAAEAWALVQQEYPSNIWLANSRTLLMGSMAPLISSAQPGGLALTARHASGHDRQHERGDQSIQRPAAQRGQAAGRHLLRTGYPRAADARFTGDLGLDQPSIGQQPPVDNPPLHQYHYGAGRWMARR